MIKKIKKQRERIKKIEKKEIDVQAKLEAVRQEILDEKVALEEMEKEYLFSLVREKNMSVEDAVQVLTGEQEEDVEEYEYQDKEEIIDDSKESNDSFFSRFG